MVGWDPKIPDVLQSEALKAIESSVILHERKKEESWPGRKDVTHDRSVLNRTREFHQDILACECEALAPSYCRSNGFLHFPSVAATESLIGPALMESVSSTN